MQASRRVKSIAPEAGDSWAILTKVRALRKQGRKPINLTIGDHDWTTPSPIMDAMDRSARGGHTGYSDILGIPDLRDAVAARVAETTGTTTSRDNIAITPGAQAALFLSFCATLDPGDSAIIIEPYYATYPETVRSVSAHPIVVQAYPEDDFQPRFDKLLAAAGDARAMLVNSPNNPTGAVYTPETIDAICEVCRQKELWLLTDEVYAGQVHEGRHVSPYAQSGMIDRTLHIGSFSKSHVMTGFRIGWIAGPSDLIALVGDLMTSTTYGVPGFIQDAALFAATRGQDIEKETTSIYRRRREKALDVLRGAQHVRVVAPRGAMYIMLDIRATGMSGQSFAEKLLEEEDIAVMPGESFGAAAAGHLRIALTVEETALCDALNRLTAFAAVQAQSVATSSE